jgi:hypothetical protein
MWHTVRNFPSIVFTESLAKTLRYASVMNDFVLFANENVYEEEFVHWVVAKA